LNCKSFLVSHGFFLGILYMNCTRWMHSADLVSGHPHVLSLKQLNRFLWNFIFGDYVLNFIEFGQPPFHTKLQLHFISFLINCSLQNTKMMYIVFSFRSRALIWNIFWSSDYSINYNRYTHIHIFY
jgi:hypothetical protein